MFRTSSGRLLASCAALVLVLGTGFAGPAVADDDTSDTDATGTSETVTPADDSDPETTATSTSPTSTTSTTPTSTPTSPTSTTTTSSTSTVEPPPTTPDYHGIMNIRAVDVTTGADVPGADVRLYLYEDGPQNLPLPASVTLPAGHYRVALLGIPAGYRLVSAWHTDGVVKAGETVDVVFELQPVAGSAGRVPIQSIPSGRTR